ncbi:MAG: molybdopterin-dependent oxidoreductase [Nitrospirae bacterium]|nr:molybdopterin-dependent oxidoreductase [Nitrospirota bacterium]
MRNQNNKKIVRTTCANDCADACSILVYVEGEKIVKLTGDPDHKITRGFICKYNRQEPERLYNQGRVLSPMKQIHGSWKKISWDEALDTIAEKIRHYQTRYGSLSILHYQGAGSFGALKMLNRRFFNLIGGVSTIAGSICDGASIFAQTCDFGLQTLHDLEDMLNSKVIILWGKNPAATQRHFIPFLKMAKKKGAVLIAIDPIQTQSTSICHHYYCPRPGSDIFLAIGIGKILLENDMINKDFIDSYTIGFKEYRDILDGFSISDLAKRCDLSVRDIEEIAFLYGKHKPCGIWLGFGVQRHNLGGETVRLIDALGSITGNIGISGGGVNHQLSSFQYFNPDIIGKNFAVCKRTLLKPLIGEEILKAKEPPIKMIFVNGGNPVNQCPNSKKVMDGFKSVDFVVTIDSFLNDTADLSHIFLPTSRYLEEDDVVGSYGHHWIGLMKKVVNPPSGVKSDLEIFQALSERLGIQKEMAGSPNEWIKRIIAPLENEGVSLEKLEEGTIRSPLAPPIPFEKGSFLTDSGKIEFIRQLPPLTEKEDRAYPFYLLSTHSANWLNSVMHLSDQNKLPEVFLHPLVGKEYGIQDGEEINLKSMVGELKVKTLYHNGVRKDMVVVHQGRWIKNGGGVNILTENVMTNVGESAAFYATKVKIEKI